MMRWSVHTVGECGALVFTMMLCNGFLRLIALEGRGDITEDINKPIVSGFCGTKYILSAVRLAALAGSVWLSAVMCLCSFGDDRKRWERDRETA